MLGIRIRLYVGGNGGATRQVQGYIGHPNLNYIIDNRDSIQRYITAATVSVAGHDTVSTIAAYILELRGMSPRFIHHLVTDAGASLLGRGYRLYCGEVMFGAETIYTHNPSIFAGDWVLVRDEII